MKARGSTRESVPRNWRRPKFSTKEMCTHVYTHTLLRCRDVGHRGYFERNSFHLQAASNVGNNDLGGVQPIFFVFLEIRVPII